jgi:IPT/TIG domain
MKPNLDQLTSIPSNFKVRGNPAAYGDEPATELNPEPATIVIGPNPTYIVDTTLPARIDQIKDESAPEPPAESAPVLTSLSPAELPVWAQDTEVFYNGSGFTDASVIIWNGSEEPTKFISATQLSTIVKPSTVQAPLPYTLQTSVKNGDKESGELNFTFIT